jgi:hypothetical protein
MGLGVRNAMTGFKVLTALEFLVAHCRGLVPFTHYTHSERCFASSGLYQEAHMPTTSFGARRWQNPEFFSELSGLSSTLA